MIEADSLLPTEIQEPKFVVGRAARGVVHPEHPDGHQRVLCELLAGGNEESRSAVAQHHADAAHKRAVDEILHEKLRVLESLRCNTRIKEERKTRRRTLGGHLIDTKWNPTDVEREFLNEVARPRQSVDPTVRQAHEQLVSQRGDAEKRRIERNNGGDPTKWPHSRASRSRTAEHRPPAVVPSCTARGMCGRTN